METKKLTYQFALKAAPTEEGIFEGYAAVFGNVDQANDVILPGAFSATLENRKQYVPICYQHDTDDVIGVCLELAEDENGLLVKGQLAIKTEKGNDAYELLKLKAITGLSIGYAIPVGGAVWSDGVRQLKQIELYEISLVTFPCNVEAQVSSVKANELTERDLEKILRDAGFSQKEAKTIISSGYKTLKSQRDVDESAALLEQIRQIYKV
jgi:HK97 family phage prohead protease